VSSKVAFSSDFLLYADEQVASGKYSAPVHPAN